MCSSVSFRGGSKERRLMICWSYKLWRWIQNGEEACDVFELQLQRWIQNGEKGILWLVVQQFL